MKEWTNRNVMAKQYNLRHRKVSFMKYKSLWLRGVIGGIDWTGIEW